MTKDTRSILPVHQTQQGLDTDMRPRVVIPALVCVAADEEVEGDDEPHGLNQSKHGPSHGHPSLRLGDHLPRTGGGEMMN